MERMGSTTMAVNKEMTVAVTNRGSLMELPDKKTLAKFGGFLDGLSGLVVIDLHGPEVGELRDMGGLFHMVS